MSRAEKKSAIVEGRCPNAGPAAIMFYMNPAKFWTIAISTAGILSGGLFYLLS
jgi:hypothetical protein